MTTKRHKIAYEEGFRSMPYKCTEDKLTIGYGFNLEAEEMPVEVADAWLTVLIERIEDQLGVYSWYQTLDYARQAVIVDMCYQMGLSGLLKFKNMIMALTAGDYEGAAVELLDSKYARQTPARAHRNADILRAGELA